MGLFSRFENKAQDVIEGGGVRGAGGIEPVKLAKRAYKEMQREKMVGVGNEYAPTLYNVLLSPEDDAKMSSYYPSLAGEIETYLTAKAKDAKLVFDCHPLVRFIVDDGLKRGRFDVIAESVSANIISDLRDEEMEHYGLKKQPAPNPRRTALWDPAAAGAAAEPRGYDNVGSGEEYHQRPEPAREQPAAPGAGRGYDRLDDYDGPAGCDGQSAVRDWSGHTGVRPYGDVAPVSDSTFAGDPAADYGYDGPAQPWPDEHAYDGGAFEPEPEPAPGPQADPRVEPAAADGARSASGAPNAYVDAAPAGREAAAAEAPVTPPERHYPPTELPAEPPQPVPQPQPQPAPSPAGPARPHERADSAAKTTLIGSAPAQPPAPRGTLYEFATGVRHMLEAPRAIIGRGSACDIVVSEPSVSRHHAEVLHDDSGWLIRDTGSTNGTNVNGSRVSQMRIYTGDVIALGNAELEFREE